METLQLIWDFLNPDYPHVDKAFIGAAISAVGSIAGSIIGGNKARKQARAARRRLAALEKEAAAVKANRPEISDPYAGFENLSGTAKDLSSMIRNPYENLGVATKAAEIKMEQTDQALANTLDTIRATGSSGGGATALAQAAAQSKQKVAANLEQQEAQNEKLRAQGQARADQMKVAEQQRLQGIKLSEGKRLQQAKAQGNIFEFQAKENRVNADLDNVYSQMQGAQSSKDAANTASAQNTSSLISGFASLGGAIGEGAANDFKIG